MSGTPSVDRCSGQRKQPGTFWLIPFSVCVIYLSSDYGAPINWQFGARACALSLILGVIALIAFHLHCSQNPRSADRIVNMYFLLSSSLALLMIVTRFLFPVTSSPDHDPSRINAILNSWLIFPFIALGLCGLLLLRVSSKCRSSMAVYCGLILAVTLTISAENSGRNLLRRIVRSLPLTQRL